MSESQLIGLRQGGNISIERFDGKVWMTKWFISDAPDEMDWAQPLDNRKSADKCRN
nr:MAG TPA: hypothetical protein [Caudoviricetes sp.]